MIVLCREQLRWIDSLPERYRTIASFGTPEDDFERIARKAEETLAAIHGKTVRVWHHDQWTTELKP